MTEKTATERLREMLDERGVAHSDHYLSTTWRDGHGILHLAGEPMADGSLVVDMLTPEQAIAATLADDDYERKMDALLCRLTNGKFSKSRAYDLDFMESCVNEEFEMLYADELNATLGSGACENVAPDYLDFLCSKCGFVHYHSDENDTGDGNDWNYCPRCGKAVKL